METFLPSEIARLVLGYLKEENCQEASKAFMRECPHLREYLAMLQLGREFSTEVIGLSLKMILDEYGNMKLSRRTQAAPGLTNLWDRYELMGAQLRQAITPDLRTQPIAPQSLLTNSMQSFTRKQAMRNRLNCARTAGVLVVRSEVAITTASAPAPGTPRRGTDSNVGGTFTLPSGLPLVSHAGAVPGGILGAVESWTPASHYSGSRGRPLSQREDDLESLVSVCSVVSSLSYEQVDGDVAVDNRGGESLNRTLTVVDTVPNQESTTPAKMISPTSRSPLSSTQLTFSTPGNLPKTSKQSAGSPASTKKNPKQPRRIKSTLMGNGEVLSPIHVLTSTSETLSRVTSVTSHSLMTSSSSIPVMTCNSGNNADRVMTRSRNLATRGAMNPSSASGVVSDVLAPVILVNDNTTPFHLFPIGDSVSHDMPSSVPCLSIPVDSCDAVPTTSHDSVPVYAVPFDSCNPGSTGFGFVPAACDMVPVMSCNSVPAASNQDPVTVTSVPAISCALDEALSRKNITLCETDSFGTPSKRKSTNRTGVSDGDNIDSQAPRTPLRSRRHLSKEFASPRDRRKKAQPCKHQPTADPVSASGGPTSANTSSTAHCSTIDSNSAKGVMSDLDISQDMLERLICNQAIAEKIAENINRLTGQNASRSDPASNTNDPDPSGTVPDALRTSLSHNPDSTAEGISIPLPFASNHAVPTVNGKNNCLVNERSEVGENVASVGDLGAGSCLDRNVVQQEYHLERMNLLLHNGQTHDETVSDVSCTSLLSLSNLDQMTDDAIRFVFDQLCADPNLDSICSMTYQHSGDPIALPCHSRFDEDETVRMDVDIINSSAASDPSSPIHCSHVELGNCTTVTDSMSTHEIPLLAGGVDLELSVPCVPDPSIPASVGLDTRRQYIQVCFPGAGGHPDRIDIVEVIGSGVEITNCQLSPDVRSTVGDGSQELPLVDSGRETASENPMLLSSQDMSNYLHSSTGVASTPTDVSGWSIPDPMTCESTLTKSTMEYFSRFVVAPSDCSQVASERDVTQSIDSGLNASPQLSTIAEGDLGGLGASGVPCSLEVDQFSNELEPSPVKVLSNSPSSAIQSGLCRKIEIFANDHSPGKPCNSTKNKRRRPGNSMKTSVVALKLDEKTGSYLLTSDSIEKKKQLGLGVPGKISESATSQPIPPDVTNLTSTCDVGQLQLSSSTGGLTSGSFPAFMPPDFITNCIAISEIPSLEGSPDIGRRKAQGHNLSMKRSCSLNRGRGTTTGSYRGNSVQSGGVVDTLISVGGASGVPSPSERVVDGSLKGIAGPPAVAMGSPGCAEVLAVGEPFTNVAIAGQPSNSGSAVDLSISSRISHPCGPTESASVPCTPIDGVSNPSHFIGSVIAPSSLSSQTPHSAIDEKKVSGHKSRTVREMKSLVVYIDPNEILPYVENQKFSGPSLLPAAIPVDNFSGVFSSSALANEKLCKVSKKSKKKSKHGSDSDKSKRSRTDNKRRKHRKADSVEKRADGDGETEQSSRASHDKKNKHRSKKKREKERKELEKECKELGKERKDQGKESKEPPLNTSSTVQLVNSSDDDDLPIAHFLKSGIFNNFCNKGSKGNTRLSTPTHCPNSTQLEAVGAKIRRKKERRKSDSSSKASKNSSSTQKSKVLDCKTKPAITKQSLDVSAITISDDSLSIAPNCSLQSNTPQVSSQAVQSVNNIESETVSGNCATLCNQKNTLSHSAQSAKTDWNKFKIPKQSLRSLRDKLSDYNMNVESSASVLPSASVAQFRSKSLENVLSDHDTVNASGIAPQKSQITPLASTTKSQTSAVPRSSRSLDYIPSHPKPSKTVVGIPPKSRTSFPTEACKPTKHVRSDRGTSNTAVETSDIAPMKSRQKIPTVSVLKLQTASQKNSESSSRGDKAPVNSASGRSQKHSFSDKLIALSLAESLTLHKHSRPKPPKTKKNEQVVVTKHDPPSLLSRATKVSEPSTYTMSCNTLLSMPSSLEHLVNKGMWCNDEPMQGGAGTEHLETNALDLRHSETDLPVTGIPVESTCNRRYDDVDIASALLSLSNSVPDDLRSPITPRKIPPSTWSCAGSSEHSTELVINSEIEIRRDPSPRYNSPHDSGIANQTSTDPIIPSAQLEKDSTTQSQVEAAGNYDADVVDFTSAARDLNIDGCCTKHLRTFSFSSPSIGLVLNIDEGSGRTPSSSSSYGSACPSVPESHADECPSSWPSEEVLRPSQKRRRSSSADSEENKKRMLRKKLKGLDITAFLKQLHPPKD